MWVKLDKDNYYTNCYCESNDPKYAGKYRIEETR